MVIVKYFFGTIQLICILIYMVMHIQKVNDKEIAINADIIDFKTLLKFIENEFKSGNITEVEYNQKRTEIISKI